MPVIVTPFFFFLFEYTQGVLKAVLVTASNQD